MWGSFAGLSCGSEHDEPVCIWASCPFKGSIPWPLLWRAFISQWLFGSCGKSRFGWTVLLPPPPPPPSSIIMHHHISRIQGRYQTSVWSTSNCHIVASQFCRRIALSISNFIWGLHSLILWDLRSILHSLSLRCASHKWGWPSQIEGTCLQKSFFSVKLTQEI